MNEKRRKKAEWGANQNVLLRKQLLGLTHQQLIALCVQRGVMTYQEALGRPQGDLAQAIFELHTKPIEPVKA